ncbi:MAG: polyprenyl synthetase family protein [Candidatus Saelkia tenebricola]|nr:polyprenyl synthetase family protein [Candidatus Saelkia tenebricola]
MKSYLNKRKGLMDEYIKIVLPFQESPKRLHEATWDCMLNGGKRIRAIIMLAIADLVGFPLDEMLNSAAGIEMIHTSTLILDDLPSMDDALLRRGKPALHRVYGEAITILLANVLLIEGIGLVFKNLTKTVDDTDELVKLSAEFLSTVGKDGIMLGQFLDLTLSNKEIKLKEIENVHAKKTAALFEISAKVAAVVSGISGAELKAIVGYAHYLGMAFQVSDDVLAVNGSTSNTGKMALTQDKRPNFIVVCGKKDAVQRLNGYIKKAVESIKVFKTKDAEPLIELVKGLKNRTF